MKNADWIAFETCYKPGDPDEVADDFQRLNSLTAGLIAENDGPYLVPAGAQSVVKYLREGGGDRPLPMCVPFDIYSRVLRDLAPPKPSWSESTFLEQQRTAVEYDRYREGISVRQLHSYATQLGQFGGMRELAVVVGLGHDFLEEAVVALGAHTTSVLIDDQAQYFGPSTLVQRKLRYSTEVQNAELLAPIAEMTEIYAEGVLALRRRLTGQELTTEQDHHEFFALGMLAFGYATGLLGEGRQTRFEQSNSIVTPHLHENSLPEPRRSQVISAIHRLVEQAHLYREEERARG